MPSLKGPTLEKNKTRKVNLLRFDFICGLVK